MICADTSFLISLYGDDVNSRSACRFQAASRRPLVVHVFNDFELANALRTLVFRGKITIPQRTEWLADYAADKAAGDLEATRIDANAVLARATLLSARHTETSGNRSYDILLVAAALTLGATDFWSFDARQRTLAAAEGLNVGP